MILANQSEIINKVVTKKVCHCQWVKSEEQPSKLIAQWICDDIIGEKN